MDHREAQVFDLEGELRRCTKQDLTHTQLLLDNKIMKMFGFYTITAMDSVVRYGHVKQNQKKGKTLTVSSKPHVFFFLFIITMGSFYAPTPSYHTT